MSDFPTELKYANSHEWAKIESDGTVIVGITDHAQDALGDIVFIERQSSNLIRCWFINFVCIY